jgi:hypothetical protein
LFGVVVIIAKLRTHFPAGRSLRRGYPGFLTAVKELRGNYGGGTLTLWR